jgi:hypothetical protein
MNERGDLNPPRRLSKRQRLALFAFILGVILFLGLLFAPFVLQNIIHPLALVAWLLLRIFVLSIDQQIYWFLLIIFACFWIAHRLFGGVSEPEAQPPAALNVAMQSAEKWRCLIQVAASYGDLRRLLKRDLTHMLITLYSSRQRDMSYTDIYEPMLQRQIPLPEPVYDLLFSPEAESARPTFLQRLRALPQLPQRLRRRWSGQDVADYHRSIDAVLTYIENSLEVPYDDKPAGSRDD